VVLPRRKRRMRRWAIRSIIERFSSCQSRNKNVPSGTFLLAERIRVIVQLLRSMMRSRDIDLLNKVKSISRVMSMDIHCVDLVKSRE
jgi:hypothetical protein